MYEWGIILHKRLVTAYVDGIYCIHAVGLLAVFYPFSLSNNLSMIHLDNHCGSDVQVSYIISANV